jgi:hypothetical protein
MKRALILATVCCSAILNASAFAETCGQRFPGSCRLEVSTTIVRTKGDTTAASPHLSRRMKRARKMVAKGVRLEVIASVPLPPPSPRRMAAFSKPTTIVDEAFNILTLSDSTDAALEAALISRRTDILDAILR